MLSVDWILSSGLPLLVIGLIIFAESGLFFGFLFPGDSLLLGAGFVAGQGKLSIYWLMVVVVVGAILGDNAGFQFGKKLGPRMFKRQDGILFRQEYVKRTQDFYDKHGGWTIILARFIAVVRTFAPIVAGVGKMDRKKFIPFNIVGGLLWGTSLPLAGYWLGQTFPNIDKYFMIFLVISANLAVIFIAWQIFKNPIARQRLREELRHYRFKKK